MEFTASQIAQFVQGRVEGDENAKVNTFAKIEEGGFNLEKINGTEESEPKSSLNTLIMFTKPSQASYSLMKP